jgi:signal transduction histidine kinase
VKAIEAGGDDFLTKPHNRMVLGARVRSLLKLKAATDALEVSFRKLRELEKVRDDLMKMIVHDLKTPLTSIIATLEMLADGDLGPVTVSQQGALRDTENKAEELLRLIDDLLEVARIEETSISLELEELQPAALIDEIMHDWSLRLQQERTTTTIEVASGVPPFWADRPLLKRVFGNLIQNSLVHSSRSVELQVFARPDPHGVLFTVADNGPGIPPQYHEVIFHKFERVKTPNVPRVRSSGLGLAFCRLVVEAHGGRIWVQSAEGAGSAFHIMLPVRPPGAEGARSSPGARLGAGATP